MAAMYSIRPQYDVNADVTLPDCMYNVANYHCANEVRTKSMSHSRNDFDTRQEKILTEVDELKREAADLRWLLGNQKTGSTTCVAGKQTHHQMNKSSTLKSRKIDSGSVFDMVISSSTAYPPLSAFILKHALSEQGHDVTMPSFRHSSFCGNVPAHLQKCIQANKDTLSHCRKGLLLTILWKGDVLCPSFIVSPLLQSRITGDANIAKYICSEFLPDLYNYKDIEFNAANNLWIETSVRQLLNGSSKEKAAAVRSANSQLGKTSWLTGNCIALADIVFWSAMVVMTAKPEKNANVTRWYKQCISHPWFTTVANAFNDTEIAS